MTKLNNLLLEIEQQKSDGEEVSEETIKKLEMLLSEFNIDPIEITAEPETESGISLFGFNEVHSLGKGWTMTVHRPHGSSATKYHTHVKGKVNGKTVEAKEALDGKSTHGKGNTMNDKKVPKDIQKKVKEHKDYKKALEEEKKAKEAKKEIKAKKLDLSKTIDIVIAIAIFIVVVGIVLLATTNITGWAAILIAIA